MRRIRLLAVLVFIITASLFGYQKYNAYMAEDIKPPQIVMPEDTIKVKCGAEPEELLAGITAKDSRDGDVTDHLMIESMSNFIGKKNNKRNMVVTAFDSAGNMAKVTRTVIYTDYKSPEFVLESPLRYPLDTTNVNIALKAKDVIDGDITGKIKISTDGNIRMDKAKNYDIIFSVANSSGDVSTLPVTFKVFDPAVEAEKPQIALTKYLVYTKKKKKVDQWKYIKSVTVDRVTYEKTEKGDVLTNLDPAENEEIVRIGKDRFEFDDKDVNYKKKGTYEALIRYSDTEGETGSMRLIIVVR